MASYWDGGLVTSIYHLQQVAAQTGNADFVARAKDLQTRASTMFFPIVQATLIKGDALQLGYELAEATSSGSTDAPSALGTGETISAAELLWNGGKPNVLFDENTSGQVGSATQEAVVSGDVGANLSAFASDLSSSASELAKNVGLPLVSKATQLLYIMCALLVALLVLFVYERGKS